MHSFVKFAVSLLCVSVVILIKRTDTVRVSELLRNLNVSLGVYLSLKLQCSAVHVCGFQLNQWRSRTFGRSGRWSNLPPFRGVASGVRAGNWRACLKYKIGVIPTKSNRTQPKTTRILRISTRCSCNALFLLQANTYEIIQYEFLREFKKKNNFRPFAAAPSKCGPVRPAPPSLRHAVQTSASYHGIDTRLHRARGK